MIKLALIGAPGKSMERMRLLIQQHMPEAVITEASLGSLDKLRGQRFDAVCHTEIAPVIEALHTWNKKFEDKRK